VPIGDIEGKGFTKEQIVQALRFLVDNSQQVFRPSEGRQIAQQQIDDLIGEFNGGSKQWNVFISHNHNQNSSSALIANHVQNAVPSRFYDADDLKRLDHIVENVRTSESVLIVLSEDDLASIWCMLELMIAFTNDIPIRVIATEEALINRRILERTVRKHERALLGKNRWCRLLFTFQSFFKQQYHCLG